MIRKVAKLRLALDEAEAKRSEADAQRQELLSKLEAIKELCQGT
jgi:hypothetical protein